MSHKAPTRDPRQASSQARDVTVPRASVSPAQKDDAHRPRPIYAGSSTRAANYPPPPTVRTLRSTGKIRPRQLGEPAPTPQLPGARSVNLTGAHGNARGMKMPSTTSSFEEVPLLMGRGARVQTPAKPSDRQDVLRVNGSPGMATNPEPSVAGSIPQSRNLKQPTDVPRRLIPELQALATPHMPPAESLTVSAGRVNSPHSPSTLVSNSPRSWSASTTKTTPTSWSSTSPSIIPRASIKSSAKRLPAIPISVTRTNTTLGLPDLPDLTSPTCDNAWSDTVPQPKVGSGKKRALVHTPAPTPPPRVSSAKRTSNRTSNKSDGLDMPDMYRPPSVAHPSPEFHPSPLTKYAHGEVEVIGELLRRRQFCATPDTLQRTPDTPPRRPSRRGVVSPGTFPRTDLDAVYNESPPSNAVTPYRQSHDEGDYDVRPGSVHPEDDPRGISRPAVTRDPTPDPPHAAPSPQSRLAKFSRLAVFGQRAKSPAADLSKSPRKLQRKGPSAGTGHEGYGKYGRRGRKDSRTSASETDSERERSVSSTRRIPLFSLRRTERRGSDQHQLSSQSDLDAFAAVHSKPVPILGGSGKSDMRHSGRLADAGASPSPATGPVADRWIAPPSPQPAGSLQRSAAPAGRWDTGSSPSLPSSRHGDGAEMDQASRPLRQNVYVRNADIHSQNDSLASTIGGSTTTLGSTADMGRVVSAEQQGTRKENKKSRWNIFRRKATTPPPPKPIQAAFSPNEMSVSVLPVIGSRPMPFYALMDSESDATAHEAPSELVSLVLDSPIAASSIYGDGQSSSTRINGQPLWEDRGQAPNELTLLPPQSQPQVHDVGPLPDRLATAEQRDEAMSPKQPRLPRVGRIPPVTTKAERRHHPSRYSFSQLLPINVAPRDDLAISQSAQPRSPEADILDSNPRVLHVFDQREVTEPSILQFQSRPILDVSTSGSSEASLADVRDPLAQTATAFVDQESLGAALSPRKRPSFDEVWNEFDDFIDDVMSSPPTQSSFPDAQLKPSTGGGRVNEEHLPTGRDPDRRQYLDNQGEATPYIPLQFTSQQPSIPQHNVLVSLEPVMDTSNSGEERQSRILLALHSSIEAALKPSTTDGPEERAQDQANGYFLPDRPRSPVAKPPSTTAREETGHQEHVTRLEQVERSKDPVAQSERHYASLMVAKWLSFGRVLFSPAHDEIHAISERNVLVIDGLGSEDWSLYCAVSYEDQRAVIHALRERPSRAGSMRPPRQHAPPNYRQAEVGSLTERFPFPSAFFSAAVVRFLPTMPEVKLKSMMAECRRVLMPGGYLELMLLDLDIVNMGVQTRRAVRELKYRMTTADKTVNLRPIIDNVQSVIGARGFTNISRCIVGVPVTGRAVSSTESSSSARSSDGSERSPFGGPGEPRPSGASPRMSFGHGPKAANLSLSDLITDHSDRADAKISKIVSKTVRSWWQHCFEASVIPDGHLSGSIFADNDVIGECKARGSSFKMLIAYAQRPVFETRRRTMSEPTVSSLATAGSGRANLTPAPVLITSSRTA